MPDRPQPPTTPILAHCAEVYARTTPEQHAELRRVYEAYLANQRRVGAENAG